MGRYEDIVLEIINVRLLNYYLKIKIWKKKGKPVDSITHKVHELLNIRVGINNSIRKNCGVKQYINSLYKQNKKLQLERNRLFKNLL